MTRTTMYDKYLEAEALVGKTLTNLYGEVGNDRLEIETEDGKRFAFYHSQDCCESVAIHDIQGDLKSVCGSPITAAHKDESEDWPADIVKGEYVDSFTWTTLTLETANAKVRVRWLGESNGYYGEGVDFEELG